MKAEEISKYVMDKLKKGGADDVVLTSQNRNSLLIKYSNNKINTTKTVDVSNMNLFIAVDKKLVTTSIFDLSKESADSAVRKLLAYAKVAEKNIEYMGIADDKYKYKSYPDQYDKKVENIGDAGVGYVEEAVNLSQEKGAKRASGVFESTTFDTYIATSNGVEASEKGTKLYFSIRAFTDKDASGHMVAVSRNLAGLDWKSAVAKASKIAKDSKNPVSCDAGKYDVIFDHLPYANMLGNIGSSASIFSVEAGLSCLAGKMGKKVASSNITFADDATLSNGFNSSPFDNEGVPTQENIIIDKGVLKTYLHNTSTARRLKVKTTANAGLISPSAFNLVLKPGDYSFDELVSQVKKGIYISNVWYTRFQNYNTGDFSTIPRDGAFLIENGKLTKPIKDLRVSDNLLNILNSTSALTKESKQIFGWEVDTPTLTPMALVKNVNITKSEA